MKLLLLGEYEVFGIGEVVDNNDIRRTTVKCASTEGKCMFIKKEHFIDSVNNYKFTD